MQRLFNNWIKYLVIAGFLLSSFSNFAQIKIIKEHQVRDPIGEISVEIINNTILIPVELGYKLRLYFIFDTGVNTTIITEPLVADILNLMPERDIKIRGYGMDEPLEGFVSSNFNYQFNDYYQFNDRDVIVLKNAINLDHFFGVPVYGLMGYDFLKDYEISVDYQKSKIYIHEPRTAKRIERLKKKKRVKVFDLVMEGTKPYIVTEIEHGNRKDSVKLLVDTGYSGALTLFPSTLVDPYLDDPYIPNYQGYGLNGQILSSFKFLDHVNIKDNLRLSDVATNFLDTIALQNVTHHETANGSIGNSILSRFKVTIDYKNEKLFLKPSKSEFKKPFFYNSSGIRVLMVETPNEGWRYVVYSVRKGSEAELAGIEKNDQLVEVNGRRIKNVSITKVYEALNDFNTLDRNIVVRRNEVDTMISFKLEPVLEWN